MIHTQTKILFILYDDNYCPIFLYHLVHLACTDAPCKNGATCLANARAGGDHMHLHCWVEGFIL